MTSLNWIVFRDIYFKIVLSIIAVIAAMLLLQNSLNNLKLRSLVAEATSSKLQITASTIESAIVRAEGLGLAMDEMAGLQDLIDRERARDAGIVKIEVVSAIGVPVATSGSKPRDSTDPNYEDRLDKEREQAFRRIFGTLDKTSVFDAGLHLYTGRIIYNSSNAVMGAIVLITPTEQYMRGANKSLDLMTNAYLIIFGSIAILLIPFIILQFSGVGQVYRALDPGAITTKQNAKYLPNSAKNIMEAVNAGKEAYTGVIAELDQIATTESGSKRALKSAKNGQAS